MELLQGEKIDPRALPYWRISGAINAALVWLLAIGAIFWWRLGDGPLGVVIGMLAFALLYSVVSIGLVPSVRWETWRYAVSEQQIELRFGVLVRHHVIIPMVRVQHVDTEQGPILKRFALSTVIIATAAGSHEIPALADPVANELREKISVLARVAEDDV